MARPWKAEYAKSSRSSCIACKKPIEKEDLRLGKMVQASQFDGFIPMFYHGSCALKKERINSIDDVEGIVSLRWEDQQKIREKIDGCDARSVLAHAKVVPSSTKTDAANWREDEESQKPTSRVGAKRRKDDYDDRKVKIAKTNESVLKHESVKNADDLESKLEAQSKDLWALKDDLKKHVSTAELRQMLKANNQDASGSELDLRDKCADGMLFGALGLCSVCSGYLHYSGEAYQCNGYLSEWSRCSNSTREPERLKGKWKIPEDSNNEYLKKWFKSQKSTKPARRMKLPVVREDYLIPFGSYMIEAPGGSSMATIKVKGLSAVHESSGLQDTGHILEDGKSIYNTTLIMSDLSTRVNRYYILQIIQEDQGSGCYVYRKWGRVGNEKIGGKKRKEMSKSDAISEFKRLFLEKTGNSWETWEQKQNFQKRPGKYFPLEIDYGVSKLAVPVIELMKMLFNVEAYRTAMTEFQIDLSKMPLGKLGKNNIQKGFEALTDIQHLLNSNAHDSSMKVRLIVDASNRFFTMIPSINPHVISDDELMSKVKMLEALQDIEIASKLVGFEADDDASFDDKYKKLRCEITPLPHDSADYQLIEKYLQNTHAPTHTGWRLELEEVFSLEREGEVDKYAACKKSLKNRMLLWHGSRLTNFVGILSQGMKIAPPEAPSTGYMFGKGVYFADLVSKSARYCFPDKTNPTGLMLLSEVALGEMHELKKSNRHMDKPPEGKHSTKGLGMTVPDESQFVKWRDDVTVPCGKPVPSKVRASELKYNEYIVYNTAQVKMQFLVKVRFHHKR